MHSDPGGLPRGGVIRPARNGDVQTMRAIERSAADPFRTLGMDEIADGEPMRPSQLRSFVADGRAWIADLDLRPAGYLLVEVVDGCGHVGQVSVDPAFRGLRLGAALVDRAGLWTGEQGRPALTLTTFRDVAWNGPYYERLGFRWLTDDEIGPELRAIREAEIAHGLDRWPRGCMQRKPG